MVAPSDRPLRVLHLTAGSDAGGLSRYIFDLSMAMQAAGHEVWIAGERGAWHGLFEQSPLRWIDLPLKGGPIALHRAGPTLIRFLRENPVDLLHVHYRRPALVGRQIQRKISVPMLYTLHLSDLSLRWPWRIFSDFGDHAHAPSQEAFDWLTGPARMPADRVTLIPHGIDSEKFPVATDLDREKARHALGLNSGDRVAVFVGRLDEPKNENWLIDLAQQSRDQLPSLKMLLVGEGPHESALRKRIESQLLGDRVQLLGHRDPLPIYQAADALLLPSWREGFSLVCAEAMSTGLAVLRTRTAGTSALIAENVTGRSVPIDREQFLAAGMEFLSDVAALRRMGSAAAQHVRQHFTFDRQVRDTIRLYRRLATKADS